MIRSAVAALLLVFSLSAVADEKAIRRVVEEKMAGAKIESIQPAPMAGLWEVTLRTEEAPRLVYTDAKATYILLGSLYDARADRIRYAQLGLQQARAVEGRMILVRLQEHELVSSRRSFLCPAAGSRRNRPS